MNHSSRRSRRIFAKAWGGCALLVIIAGFSGVSHAAGAESPGCGADKIAAGNHQERSLDVDGAKRTFILDVPEGLEAHRAAPLLLDFHGFSHSAEGVWQVSKFRDLAEREHFITAYPQGLNVHLLQRDGAGWDMFKIDGNRDIAFVKHLVDEIEQEYCIDLRRVYITGFSNGAFLSHLLACTMADRIAAVAPVSGGEVPLECAPSRPVPIIIHNGRQDPIVPVAQARALFEQWKKIDGCHGEQTMDGGACKSATDCRNGAAVVYCEGDGEHRWPPEATERIWGFFKSHPMPTP